MKTKFGYVHFKIIDVIEQLILSLNEENSQLGG